MAAVGGARVGEWFRVPSYARSLRLIAEKGPGAFCGGGQSVVAALSTTPSMDPVSGGGRSGC